MVKMIKKIFGYCESCNKWFVYPKKRRMNTMYAEDRLNYTTCCLECFTDVEEYWAERWRDYYNDRM